MFISILMLREYVAGYSSQIFLFFVASVFVWISWVIKVVLSRRYSPWTEDFYEGTSVIIPVVDEPEDLFRDVLARICDQNPTEVIVVINGKRNETLERICGEFAEVECHWTPIAGKRNALKVGVENSRQPICVLVDSDTLWEPQALRELRKPFADPRVGGVTTKQRILEPERSWITRWADWLENTRALYSMPAQSVLGQIGCLPGRTIAFRREILERCMPQFMGEKFLGVFLEVSDDRTLTNYCLKQGYRSVYQSTSEIRTDAPLQLKKLFKQQLRWARGSQYNTARMLPWYLGHTPVLGFFFLLDILIPFLLVGATAGWVARAITGTGTNFYRPLTDAYPGVTGIVIVAVLIVVSSTLSMWVRQARHLAEKPGDLVRMPVFIIASTFFLMPVRLIGFVRMAHSASWGTRKGAYSAKDGPQDFTPVPRQLVAKPHVGELSTSDIEMLLNGEKPDEGRMRVAEHVSTEQDAHTVIVDAPTPTPVRKRHRPNVLAAVPYMVAVGAFFLMSLTWM